MTEKTQPASYSPSTEEPVKKKIGRPRGPGFYLSNGELLAEWIKSKDHGSPTTGLVNMFQLMSERISRLKFYSQERDRKDVIAGGVMDALMNWEGFNLERGNNAFAYFTSVIRNGQHKAWHIIHPDREDTTIRLSDNMAKYM
jgi:hypothetical protein